jgi:polyisoprenoid-binding protein YceI
MSASRRSSGRSSLPFVIVVAVLALLALGIGGIVYMFSGSAPAAVSLSTSGASGTPATPASTSPVATVASSPARSSSLPPAAPLASAAVAPASSAGGNGALDGTWNVDTSLGSFSDFSDSFVGYRVNENLSQVGSTTAVGRTPKVSGSLTFAGNAVMAASITADLTALQSDRSMRDGQLHQQALQTDQFPTATFVLASPIRLDSAPTDGQTISVTAQGKLTLHGVTREVSIPLQAKLSGGVVTVVGSLPITFADYNIAPPRSMLVLSVDDHGTLELQLHFTKG